MVKIMLNNLITSEIMTIINDAWDNYNNYSSDNAKLNKLKNAINIILQNLDCGEIRVSYKNKDVWEVNQYIKKAILLYFRTTPNNIMNFQDSDCGNLWYDKVPLKFCNWDKEKFDAHKIRAVPTAIARFGSHIGKNVVLMPSFVNIGAYIGDGTMIDTWATIGSCAQIGKNCHISGGAGIGGVLEPLQANPVIIEDNCFIGARSEVAEGVIIGEGSVLSMGVYLGASTKILDRSTGKITSGYIPPYSVVVSGTMADSTGNANLYCAVIVKTVDAQTRSKTSINELLRM
jgi:2,3,4,5-tetrahydropyridine-2,6-dicarboxylate N-succinyltransferase